MQFQMDEGLTGVGAGQPFQALTHQRAADSASAADDGKSFARLAAEVALDGGMLYRLASGGYLLLRCGAGWELPDLRAAAEQLELVRSWE